MHKCLAAGHDVEALDDLERTALHVAAELNPNALAVRAAVAALLDAGADIRALDKDGLTALHSAARNSSADAAVAAIEALVAAGADVGREKRLAKQLCTGLPGTAALRQQRQPSRLCWQLEQMLGRRVLSALHWGARNSSHEAAAAAIGALVAAGADVGARDEGSVTALHSAAVTKGLDTAVAVAAALLEAGASPAARNRAGRQPWVMVCKRTDVEACAELLRVLLRPRAG